MPYDIAGFDVLPIIKEHGEKYGLTKAAIKSLEKGNLPIDFEIKFYDALVGEREKFNSAVQHEILEVIEPKLVRMKIYAGIVNAYSGGNTIKPDAKGEDPPNLGGLAKFTKQVNALNTSREKSTISPAEFKKNATLLIKKAEAISPDLGNYVRHILDQGPQRRGRQPGK